MLSNCKIEQGQGLATNPTLTVIIEQTEKQLMGVRDIVEAIELKLAGPIPTSECNPCGSGGSGNSGIYERAARNLEDVNSLAFNLSRIADRL